MQKSPKYIFVENFEGEIHHHITKSVIIMIFFYVTTFSIPLCLDDIYNVDW